MQAGEISRRGPWWPSWDSTEVLVNGNWSGSEAEVADEMLSLGPLCRRPFSDRRLPNW